MKKIFTLVAMALMAVGAYAQGETVTDPEAEGITIDDQIGSLYKQYVIAERDFTGGFEGDYPYWSEVAEGQEVGINSDPEGVAITVGNTTGVRWEPQLMVIDGFYLEEGGTYKVVITAKFPCDGKIQINMCGQGNLDGSGNCVADVESTGDFQTVEFLYRNYPCTTTDDNGNPDGFVLFQPGDFEGTTILKSVKVIDMGVVAAQDFTGGFKGEYPYFYQFADGQEGSVTSDPEGVAITVGNTTGLLWEPQVIVIPDDPDGLYLEEGGNYKVVINAKFPCSGTLQINLGSWFTNDQYPVYVESTGDFQQVEIPFRNFVGTTLDEKGHPNGHVVFQCGDFKGTTILKSVKVIDMGVVGVQDFTGGFKGKYSYWYQFADGQEGSVTSDPEGVAINVGTLVGEVWQPQVVALDGLYLDEGGNYKVEVIAKFPCDGTLQIRMGDWRDPAVQYQVDVKATGDFQRIQIPFRNYPYTTFEEDWHPNGLVVFQCGDFKGTTILKGIKVIDMDAYKYKLTYKIDGNVYKTYYLSEGAAIGSEKIPTREGYVYLNWNEIPETMPDYDVTIYGTFAREEDVDKITIGSNGKGTYSSTYDLDFSQVPGLKAYIAAGYEDESQTIWLMRIQRVSAETGLMVKGEAGKTFYVPHTESSSCYGNYFVANTGPQITINETDGDMTNFYMSGGTFKKVKGSANIGKNKCYLQLPTSVFGNTRSIGFNFEDNDDGATGIATPESDFEETDNVFYNLQGQRMENPQKGLYIRNGKKIIVR